MNALHYYRTIYQSVNFDWKNCLYTDAISNSIHIPYSSSLDFTGKSYTIVAWTNSPAGNTGVNPLITNWNGIDYNTQYYAFLMGLGGGDLRTGYRILTSGSVQTGVMDSALSSAGFTTNHWDFRFYQYDIAGVNGVSNAWNHTKSQINTGDMSEILIVGSSSSNTVLSNYSFLNKIWSINTQVGNSAGGIRHNKYIDTLALFDRALTRTELFELFNSGNGYDPTKIPNCVACYLLNEPNGTAILSSSETPGSLESKIILDSSGNGNHAYATGYASGSIDFVDHHTLL